VAEPLGDRTDLTEHAVSRESPGAQTGLALFLNAGDPSFEVLRQLVMALDECRIDCLELAVPFPNVVTDGPVIRRSAARALEVGADLSSTLLFVAALRPHLTHLKIVLMADWRYTVCAVGIEDFLDQVQRSGCDGALLHGVPSRVRRDYYQSARRIGLPIVTTCFVSSSPRVMEEAAADASAYLYLVSHYGRGEGASRPDPSRLAPVIGRLRQLSRAPIAVGFGVRTRADVRAVAEAGADAAIVGSACVACLERTLLAGNDPVAGIRGFVAGLRGPGEPRQLERAAGSPPAALLSPCPRSFFDSRLAVDHR
jgi:tryptophan synthase alpha chain